MGKTYKSARGKDIDMEKLSLKHETTPAVGNLKVNARGDQLGPGGKIDKTREQVLADYYKKHPEKKAEHAQQTNKNRK